MSVTPNCSVNYTTWRVVADVLVGLVQVSMHAATVEDNALIGIGAILLEGSRVSIHINTIMQSPVNLCAGNAETSVVDQLRGILHP